tara:strand:- start:19 stop:606 length:588 start_codon:yes stop_codon:yes gene_type:complete
MKKLLLILLCLPLLFTTCKKEDEEPNNNTGNNANLSIGDFHQGGIIFWLDESSKYGLVCDIQDLGEAQWSDFPYPTEAVGLSIGTGQSNTNKILDNSSQFGIAAYICVNSTAQGYSDWFLPSKAELNQMYLNKSYINSTAQYNGGSVFQTIVSNNFYWSSSEYNNETAYKQDFNDGNQYIDGKFYTYRVRAIRDF